MRYGRGDRIEVRPFDRCSHRSDLEVTWCLHIWHPTSEEIKACVNGTARYSTHTATALGIERDIDYLPECRTSRGKVYKGCLLIKYGRVFHDNAILSLSIDNKDTACIVNDYYKLDLKGTSVLYVTCMHMG